MNRPQNGRFLAGEYPSAKEATAKLGRYLDCGVTTFLDLTEEGGYHLRPYATAVQEMAAARGREVAHKRLSIPDLATPSTESMVTILDTLVTP